MAKEKPIIFSTSMVQAIVKDSKTQTRRVIKSGLAKMQADHFGVANSMWCPYGKVGDTLWVREAWAAESKYDWTKPSEIPQGSMIFYPASGRDLRYAVGKTRPSIFMPRWASHITLKITDIRVERLQDITEGDAKAEGVSTPKVKGSWQSYVWAFKDIWNSINAKRGYGWETNPWIWVISFERLNNAEN